jgi:hypothetical protein
MSSSSKQRGQALSSSSSSIVLQADESRRKSRINKRKIQDKEGEGIQDLRQCVVCGVCVLVMSKASLVAALQEFAQQRGHPLSGRFVAALSDEVFRHVSDSLAVEKSFRYPGFGTLIVKFAIFLCVWCFCSYPWFLSLGTRLPVSSVQPSEILPTESLREIVFYFDLPKS